jgi:quinol monooxygenase YgiN
MSIRRCFWAIALSSGLALAVPIRAASPAVPPPDPPPSTSDVDSLTGPAVITVISIYRAQPGHEAEAGRLLETLSDATRQEKGNIVSSVHRSLSDPREYVLYEQFETRAALSAHRATAGYKQAMNGLKNAATVRLSEEFTPLLPG